MLMHGLSGRAGLASEVARLEARFVIKDGDAADD